MHLHSITEVAIASAASFQEAFRASRASRWAAVFCNPCLGGTDSLLLSGASTAARRSSSRSPQRRRTSSSRSNSYVFLRSSATFKSSAFGASVSAVAPFSRAWLSTSAWVRWRSYSFALAPSAARRCSAIAELSAI